MQFASVQRYQRVSTTKTAELSRKIWKTRLFAVTPQSRNTALRISPRPALLLDGHAHLWCEVKAALVRIERGA